MAAIMRQIRKQILTIAGLTAALVLSLMLLIPAPAQADSLVTAIVTDPLTGVALEGYDPVSYFIGPEPLEGKPDYTLDWGGVPWYFATAANRDVFARHPEIYAPQYGGHCVMSLSRGFLSDGKPRLYVVDRMKLYLFYSTANRAAFVASRDGALNAASSNWPRLAPDLDGPQPGADSPLLGVANTSQP